MARPEPVTFSTGNRMLHGTLFRPEDTPVAKPALVLVHGWRSSQPGYHERAAVWLSTLRPVRWLALRAPADHPRDRLGSALAPLRTFDGDVLVVECARDEVVPRAAVMGLVNALDDPDHMSYEVIPDEDHQLSTPESQQRFIDLLRRWFGSRPVRDLERAR